MPESIAAEVIAAALGGCISASVLYPLEVLKTKQMASLKEENDDEDQEASGEDDAEGKEPQLPPSMVQFAVQLYEKEGIRVFFSGVEASAFQSMCEKALYFFAYTAMKSSYSLLSGSDHIGTGTNLTIGYLSEWAHLPFTLPLDCLSTAIQTNKDPTKGPMQILLNMLSEKGVGGMYKGVQAYWVLCVKPALQYTVFEQVKAIMVAGRQKKSLGAAESFLLGMVARTISTLLVFPYLRAKVLLQTQGDDEPDGPAGQPKTNSIPVMLSRMYQKGGLSALYRGIGPELTRGVLSSALMLMIKEQLAQTVSDLVESRKQRKRRPALRR